MQDFVLQNPHLLAFYDSFPRNFTCWHFGRGKRRCRISSEEKAAIFHTILITDRAAASASLDTVTCWEHDAATFGIAEKHQRQHRR
jgi:hypothetical protein